MKRILTCDERGLSLDGTTLLARDEFLNYEMQSDRDLVRIDLYVDSRQATPPVERAQKLLHAAGFVVSVTTVFPRPLTVDWW